MWNGAAVLRRSALLASRSFSSKREVRIIKKLVFGGEKQRKKWYASPENPQPTTAISLSRSEGQGKEANRRVVVLNKLFMKNVSEIMATGELSPQLLGKGIEISKVKVSSDFQILKVYWIAKGTVHDAEVEATMHRIAGPLRHELSQLRLMGEIPKIYFVKDKNLALDTELSGLLARADYGEEFEPQHGPNAVKGEFAALDPVMLAKNELPAMTNNIFGLDHSAIMNRLARNLGKRRHAWEKYEMSVVLGARQSPQPESVGDGVREVESVAASAARREEFAKFLEKRHHRKTTPERKRNIGWREGFYSDATDSIAHNEDDYDYIDEGVGEVRERE